MRRKSMLSWRPLLQSPPISGSIPDARLGSARAQPTRSIRGCGYPCVSLLNPSVPQNRSSPLCSISPLARMRAVSLSLFGAKICQCDHFSITGSVSRWVDYCTIRRQLLEHHFFMWAPPFGQRSTQGKTMQGIPVLTATLTRNET